MTLKLLVVDDSPNVQRIVKLAFSSEDAVVESVTDGESALDAAKAFGPDVVLADVCMPGRSGYEICAAIKEDPELALTPVVLLVGTFDPFDEQEASRVGSDGSLTKPFDTSDLLQTVIGLAERRHRELYGESAAPGAGAPVEAAGMAAVAGDVSDSFLGAGRILDLFDGDELRAAAAARAAQARAAEMRQVEAAVRARAAGEPVSAISEKTLNSIVDTVLRRMSAEVIREVAWEVVPELSESIIRRTIEEQERA